MILFLWILLFGITAALIIWVTLVILDDDHKRTRKIIDTYMGYKKENSDD